ncbi:TetR family transcriptional regulator [Nocardioides flavus (ex Wang et al. 2016)]|uniref:TetR family transcriptional regulator n=1 Tax=Nocardioides flavus (ex Wang et al. 2016) TaxID=2058780 RepID=A0ABQ3HJ95_9ACTN|nr:TetR/AcrR family transcriptional regulator [Nocardioides flavus (ex Wang et al. 2016)]GHE16747.1 TetR family transcriptional regulator [Nocardioides flavus (ex Wang et al. 2016)]
MRTAQRAARRRMSPSERRQQIVTSAADLFDEGGYTSTTMDDIARGVGLAKPTLYHYFPSKDEILHAIHEEFIDLLINRHEQRTATGLGPEQLLLEVMADILELMETHRGHVRVFFEHHRELPSSEREAIKVKRDKYEQFVEELITEGIRKGIFRETDPHLATLATFGMCNWAYQWYRAGGTLRSREVAYQFWNYLVYGISASSASPTS